MSLSTFLSPTATQLRGLMWMALDDVGQVVTGVATSDSGGGASVVWTAGSSLACRIDPLTSLEGLTADRISDRSSHIVTTPAGTTVTTGNRFAITGRGTYEVTAVHDTTGALAQIFEVVSAS